MGCCKGRKCTLQDRVKIAACVDMVLAIISISVNGTELRYLNEDREDPKLTENERNEALKSMYLASTIILINCIKLVMGYFLWKGANLRQSKGCKIWLGVTIILWLIHLTDFIIRLAVGSNTTYVTVTTSLEIVGRIGAMVMVTLFIRELANEKRTGGYV